MTYEMLLESSLDYMDSYLESGFGYDDYKATLQNIIKETKNVQRELKVAKEKKDYKGLKKCSEKVDDLIKDIEYFKKNLDYEKFKDINQIVSVLNMVKTVCSAVVIAMAAFFTIKGLSSLKEEIASAKDETDAMQKAVSEMQKSKTKADGTKTGKATAMIGTGAGFVVGMMDDRRKVKGAFDNAIYSLNKLIAKLTKINKKIQKEITKLNRGELTKESVLLEIYESERHGIITKDEKDLLKAVLEASENKRIDPFGSLHKPQERQNKYDEEKNVKEINRLDVCIQKAKGEYTRLKKKWEDADGSEEFRLYREMQVANEKLKKLIKQRDELGKKV